MGVNENTYTINTLNSTSTFYDWFQKENTEIIAKLNLLKVYGATSGDGVLASTDVNGLLSVSIGGTSGIIQSPLIFNNTVTFNGNVNVPNVNILASGITSGTTGYTFGTPVRIYVDPSNIIGLTASRANNPDNAEVIGLISSMGQTYSYIAVGGKIDGNFQSVNADGKGLSAGCIYFLDPNNPGKITIDEPIVTGYVSKPVIMGLTGNSGLVLQFRGNYLNADLTSYGSSGSNQISFTIDGGVYTTAVSEILLGDVLSYSPTYAETLDGITRKSYNGWFHSIDNAGELQYIVGVVIAKQTVGANPDVIITLQLSGYTNVYTSYLNGGVYLNNYFDVANRGDSPQLFNTDGNAGTSPQIARVYDFASNSAVIDIQNVIGGSNPQADFRIGIAPLSSNVDNYYDNILINGDFSIWQRTEVGKYSSYTDQGNVKFADMWRRHDGVTGSSSHKNYYITRQTFGDYQNVVEGNPKYYVDIKALGLSANAYTGLSGGEYPAYSSSDHLTIGHVIPDAKYFDDKDIAVSFYAKTSTNQMKDVNVYLARYNGTTLLDHTVIGSVTLKTTWDRYDLTRFINGLTGSFAPLTNDYCEVGLDLIPAITQANDAALSLSSSSYISLTSVNAGIGSSTTRGHSFKSFDEKLKYCQQFYYTTYIGDERVGFPTMTSQFDVSNSTPFLIALPQYACSMHMNPAYMRITPAVTIYSPYSGAVNEAYNTTAMRELRYTSGTIGYNSAVRIYRFGIESITSSSSVNSVLINMNTDVGYVPYDKIHYHFVADADYSI